jgi:hypothetical protein
MSINFDMDAGIVSAMGAALAVCEGAGAGNEAANVSAMVVAMVVFSVRCKRKRKSAMALQ